MSNNEQTGDHKLIATLTLTQLFRMNNYKKMFIWLNEASRLKGKAKKNEVGRCYFIYFRSQPAMGTYLIIAFEWVNKREEPLWKLYFSMKKNRSFRLSASSTFPTEYLHSKYVFNNYWYLLSSYSVEHSVSRI